ncbi:exo-beta-N-acetylmuramidase NamZ domain-containing protein [Pontibacter silvestris]|uniref:Exo-beta-N-acetylmuramidase NamZ domain-containing protein n=1 Tax=Pontibacter silvestris TaxID=2305183 RepID=A0ABW4WTM1_9BACT|nr:DUF1343 domain-containing protein [Pontibacter silvestris]MCC9136288.1 DUF1343 domain-containing protein [Pontibacter silvestris]
MIQPLFILYTSLLLALGSCSQYQPSTAADAIVVIDSTETASALPQTQPLKTGAERTEMYLKLLQGKRVGMVVNQTSVIGQTHLVDSLLSRGIQIKTIFAPEHGFRGDADAGAHVKDAKDIKTGLPIISLYGKNKKPLPEQLQNLDIVVFDIQDVGARFYTYISTMHYVMEACAENNKPLLILDRPNPNGHYVDGPVLEPALKSFVGMHPIPIVHGLTIGELAKMINGEKWLEGQRQCKVTIIPVVSYTHNTAYTLPIKPSPNLPNAQAIALYPSLCLFEGTSVSVGRGTSYPFQVIGSPYYKHKDYSFMPESMPGAGDPPYKGQKCYGLNLTDTEMAQPFTLTYVLDFYKNSTNQDKFFNSFFEKLAGTPQLREQIKAGKTEAEIRATWEPALSDYKNMRKQYLLYSDSK